LLLWLCSDVIAQAKSGTGKTFVFCIPVVEATTPALHTQSLILVPTREIAQQILDVLSMVSKYADRDIGARCFIGGTNLALDRTQAKAAKVAVGTPGRVRQLIEDGVLVVQHVRVFVLDEADKMLTGDFTETVRWIHSVLPTRKQCLALSATFNPEQLSLLDSFMNSPLHVMLCSDSVSLQGIPFPCDFFFANFFFVREPTNKPQILITGVKQLYEVVDETGDVLLQKQQLLLKLLATFEFVQCIVFTNDRNLYVFHILGENTGFDLLGSVNSHFFDQGSLFFLSIPPYHTISHISFACFKCFGLAVEGS
jgi:superfamily II DNA/RNA helicase